MAGKYGARSRELHELPICCWLTESLFQWCCAGGAQGSDQPMGIIVWTLPFDAVTRAAAGALLLQV